MNIGLFLSAFSTPPLFSQFALKAKGSVFLYTLHHSLPVFTAPFKKAQDVPRHRLRAEIDPEISELSRCFLKRKGVKGHVRINGVVNVAVVVQISKPDRPLGQERLFYIFAELSNRQNVRRPFGVKVGFKIIGAGRRICLVTGFARSHVVEAEITSSPFSS